VVSFAEHILWQELQSGKMYFTSWSNFTEEFMSCSAQKMRQPQCSCDLNLIGTYKANYIDEFKDLVDLSDYTDPIAIMLKFC
jgi:hypothetical protein